MSRSQDSYAAGKALKASASGVTLLILVQLGVKLFTFTSNQLILRSLSPTILGIATQLDIFSITVLYFSRESIRIAAQRQPIVFPSTEDVRRSDSSADDRSKTSPMVEARSRVSQSVVNASYLSLGIGIPLTMAGTMFYVYFAPNEAFRVPFFRSSVVITAAAAFLELSTEPFFAIVQQRMLYKIRATVEMSAAFIKSVIICGAFAWASWADCDVGLLPFALGYLGYSLALICGYSIAMLRMTSEDQFSYLLTRIRSRCVLIQAGKGMTIVTTHSDKTDYMAGRFSRSLVSLSANVFFQSMVKHLLSQGDSMILASMASLEDQGTYSLVSNYGGLIARILFQPIEESSRNLFSLLLGPSEATIQDIHSLGTAKSHLIDILRGYGVLSVITFPIGPALAPHLLHLLGGRRWTSPEVDSLLSLYCYYIPLLAFNGITEAFVSAAASPADLRTHAGWMGAFSACFALMAYMFLRVGALGAHGVVWANIAAMTCRLLWSYVFIKAYFRRYKTGLALSDASPRLATYAVGMISILIMPAGPEHFGTDIQSVLRTFFFSIAYTLLV